MTETKKRRVVQERRHRQPDGTVEVRKREVHYAHDWPEMQQADRERLKSPSIPADRLASTIFLAPRSSYEFALAREFLLKRYPNVNLSQLRDYIPIGQLPAMLRDRVQLVVIVRRGINPDQRGAKPGTRIVDKKTGEMPEERPYSELIPDVIESAPLQLIDCIDADTDLYGANAEFSTDELVERLSEIAYPAVVFRMDADKQIILKDS